MQEGSLYPVLYRLSDCGYISDTKVKVGKRMTRVYYHIEAEGLEHLEILKREYSKFEYGMSLIISSSEDKNNEDR